jgi:hypothetical protein
MVYYDDDDDYNTSRSMTPKEIERIRRQAIPSIKEIVEILNTDRHGVFMNLRTWKNKTKSDYNKQILSDLEELVTEYRPYLTNNTYKFYSDMYEDENGNKFDCILYGKNKIPITQLV